MDRSKWENKVLLGDCVEVLKDCPDGTFDLIVTDVPYNTGMTGKKDVPSSRVRLGRMFNDNYEQDEYDRLVAEWSRLMYRVLRDDAACYVYINWKQLGLWLACLESAGFAAKNVIVWDKIVHGLNYQNYAYVYELIIYVVKGKFTPNNKENYDAGFWKDIWHLQRQAAGTEYDGLYHATEKYLPVVEIPVLHGSKPGELVLDLFGGSGTTAVAARNLNRHYCLIEKVPEYVRLAELRLLQGTLI